MLVSVCIPCYNYGRFVLQAIESVLAQTWPDIDLIVIDDGSTDDSFDIISRFHKERGGFRFVSRDNKGLVHTLNQGLRMAEGEFFTELSADDFLPPDSIERRVTYLQGHPECVAVFGDELLVEGHELTNRTVMREKHRRMFGKADPIPDILRGAFPLFPTGLIRRKQFLDVGGFDPRLCHYEDLDTPVRLALVGRLGCLDDPVIFRREHGTNVSSVTSHIRGEKVVLYSVLLENPAMLPYRRLLKTCLRRALLALGRYLDRVGGGTPREREIFRGGWPSGWRDPRLLWYLLKWGR